MIDGIIKADGTSRLMRAELPATYEEFRAQCHVGAQPLDVLFNSIGWSQLPTFLNKTNLLKDPTAALFGLGTDAVPDDVFGVLSRFQSGLGNEYVWEKTKDTMVETYYGLNAPTHFYVAYNRSSANVPFSDTVAFNDDGSAYLVNPQTITLNNSNKETVAATLSGKYVDNTTIASGANENTVGIFKFPENDVISYNSGTGFFLYSCYSGGTGKLLVKGVKDSVLIGYVNSPDHNAYPIDDGYTYTALGQIGNKVRIATGSYVGTGTSGASNPNSLTFDFEPKVWGIYGYHDISNTNFVGYGLKLFEWGIAGSTYTWGLTGGTFSHAITTSYVGKTVSWYGEDRAKQFNEADLRYFYIAIG